MDNATFDAIADPTRRALLDILRAEGPQRAGDLAQRFPQVSRPAVSKHLRLLRQARLVRVEKDGRARYYRLEARHLEQVAQWVAQYEVYWQERLAALKEAAERND
ncbi:MAG: ArsR family transcriptional regulator [Anaerolineae bacterium]|nr:MAG: ArsR family transcriptional regulator [Anaerolineae bacterium]